jgi:hypothetical protein
MGFFQRKDRSKKITYTSISPEDCKTSMQVMGWSDPMIEMASFLADIENNQREVTSSELKEAQGRKPKSLEEGLQLILNPRRV